MSNDERAKRRAYLLNALQHNEAQRQAVLAAYEANPHSIDNHTLADVGRPAKAMLAEYLSLGGNLSDVYPGEAFEALPKRRK
jgi:hypothetical protein